MNKKAASKSAVFVLIACGFCFAQSIDQKLEAPDKAIPAAYFGLHIHRLASTTPWPAVEFHSWRLIAAYVDWSRLEPQPGKYDFKTLDLYVDAAAKHSVEPMLTLLSTPAWASSRPQEKSALGLGGAAPPKNIEDWKAFVQTVGTRYKGKIHEYEIWNEPNLRDFYTGDVNGLVTLTREAYKILKSIDQSNVIVSPSCTGGAGLKWLDEFFEKGGGNYIDVVGYHLYVTPEAPEAMIPRIRAIEALMSRHGIDKPLWNTETGWFIANHQSEVKPQAGPFSKVLDDSEAAAYVARAFVLAWAAGVARFYWYSWDNWDMGLTDRDGKTLKPAAKAYSNVERWLVGAAMGQCILVEQKAWICSLSRSGGYKGQIAWAQSGNPSFPISTGSGLQYSEDVSGKTADLKGKTSIPLNSLPILVENKRLK